MKLNKPVDEQKKEINKTRVENVGFSRQVVEVLCRNNIRTIGGIENRTKSELQNLLSISISRAEEIIEKIEKFSAKEILRKPLPTKEVVQSQPQVQKNDSPDIFEVSSDEEDVVRTLAERLGSTKKEVISPSRKQEIVRVRDLVAYLLREYGDMSYPAIGRLLGGRDHTTIIHAYKKIKKTSEENTFSQQGLGDLIESVKTIKNRKEQVEKEIIDILSNNTLSKLRAPTPIFRNISERNLKVLELYREGLTLENIGNEINVTRERVRQIVFATVRQTAVNEAITKGIVMDSDVLLAEELKKRKLAQEEKRNIGKTNKPKEKRWSRYHTSCQKCGGTTIPHVRNGLCEQCMGQFRGERRENIIAQHNNKCDVCDKTRAEAAALHGRDLYITKDRKVFCNDCFRQYSGKRLGGYKNYEWSRFYPKCKLCNTTTIPYSDNGLCENCSEKITSEQRNRIIKEHGDKCDVCSTNRSVAQSKFKIDLFITKTGKVLCKLCFHKNTD